MFFNVVVMEKYTSVKFNAECPIHNWANTSLTVHNLKSHFDFQHLSIL